MPDPAVLDSDEIDIVLGGCCITDDDPTHRCANCGDEFGKRRARPDPSSEIG
jgi:hypothetical protein